MTDKPSDAEIIMLAVESGVSVRTGKGAVKLARAVLAKWGQSAQAVEPVATQWLAEMVMSDCGCSTGNQRLLDRIIDRIQHYDRANTAPQPVAREPVESSDRRWLCLLCKSSREGSHGVLDDSITPCPNGIKGGQHVGNVD